MSYTPPYIDAAGLHIPTYPDILDLLVTGSRTIYGQNIYLGIDSADYQQLSMFALLANDCVQGLQLAYNARSPLTAVGADLDTIVKSNGIARKAASFSTATLTIVGAPGTILTNAIAQDQDGYQWALPLSLTIPLAGTINVTAACTVPGKVSALQNSITIRATPTSGWISVNNQDPATAGQPVESDSQLRAQQALSVALPSRTLLAGTAGAVARIPGVTRSVIEENFTGIVDANGCPPHSITAVVEGGDQNAVALAIFRNKGIGAYTNGRVSITIIDPDTSQPSIIRFDRPVYVPVFVSLSVHGLQGYTTATAGLIVAAITNYLNSLQIGESLTLSALYAVASSVMPNLSLPQFSIEALTIGTAPGPAGTADIAIAFDHVVQGIAANVVLTPV